MPLYEHANIYLFRSTVGGHVSCLQSLAMMNEAVVNILGHVLVGSHTHFLCMYA